MSIITKLLTTITHKRNTYRLGFVLTWQKESGWTLRPREKESLPFLIIYNSEEEGERIGVGWFEGWGMEGLAMLRQLIGQLQELLELYGSHPSSLVLPSPSLSPLPHPLHLLQPLPPPPPLLSQFHQHQHQQQQQQQHHRFFSISLDLCELFDWSVLCTETVFGFIFLFFPFCLRC